MAIVVFQCIDRCKEQRGKDCPRILKSNKKSSMPLLPC